VTFTNAQRSTRNAKRQSDLRTVQNALELYYSTGAGSGTYPTSANYAALCCAAGTPLATYLPQGIPHEPQSAAAGGGGTKPDYTYAVGAGNTSYALCVQFSNFEGTAGGANIPAASNGTTSAGQPGYCFYNEQ
jgi:hypothetical protein